MRSTANSRIPCSSSNKVIATKCWCHDYRTYKALVLCFARLQQQQQQQRRRCERWFRLFRSPRAKTETEIAFDRKRTWLIICRHSTSRYLVYTTNIIYFSSDNLVLYCMWPLFPYKIFLRFNTSSVVICCSRFGEASTKWICPVCNRLRMGWISCCGDRCTRTDTNTTNSIPYIED